MAFLAEAIRPLTTARNSFLASSSRIENPGSQHMPRSPSKRQPFEGSLLQANLRPGYVPIVIGIFLPATKRRRW